MDLLKDSLSTMPTHVSRLLKIVLIMDDPDAYPAPSPQYRLYSSEVSKAISALKTEPEAREFVLETYMLSGMVMVPGVAVWFPPLREYVKYHRKTPELLITLYHNSDVVGEDEGAEDWLRMAHDMDPENEYVLWMRLLGGREGPWFPERALHSTPAIDQEISLLDRLLKRNPNDALALGVKMRIEQTRKAILSQGNAQYRNSISRVAPLPETHLGFLAMMQPAHYRNTRGTREG
jgi:hypothetical protein